MKTMAKRVSKIYPKTINKFSTHNFSNWKGHKSLSVRDYQSKGSLETYTLSAELDRFDELKVKILDAELHKKPIKIEFVRKFGKKFINEIS